MKPSGRVWLLSLGKSRFFFFLLCTSSFLMIAIFLSCWTSGMHAFISFRLCYGDSLSVSLWLFVSPGLCQFSVSQTKPCKIPGQTPVCHWSLSTGQSAQQVPTAPFPGFLTERFQPLSLGGDLFHFEFLPHFLSLPQNKTAEPKKQRSLKYTLNLGRRNARESVEYCCCSRSYMESNNIFSW